MSKGVMTLKTYIKFQASIKKKKVVNSQLVQAERGLLLLQVCSPLIQILSSENCVVKLKNSLRVSA